MTLKKRLHCRFGCHFCKINAHTAILRRFANFAKVSTYFARFFTKSKRWGCGCTSCTPASYTSADANYGTTSFKQREQVSRKMFASMCCLKLLCLKLQFGVFSEL